MTDAERLASIERRVRATICPTFGTSGETVEGRILEADFNTLLDLMHRMQTNERERCASLHESVNPANDDERQHGIPGAGAMGAVIEYRNLIRSPI